MRLNPTRLESKSAVPVVGWAGGNPFMLTSCGAQGGGRKRYMCNLKDNRPTCHQFESSCSANYCAPEFGNQREVFPSKIKNCGRRVRTRAHVHRGEGAPTAGRKNHTLFRGQSCARALRNRLGAAAILPSAGWHEVLIGNVVILDYSAQHSVL